MSDANHTNGNGNGEAKSPAYQWYARDYQADEHVRLMTYEQEGIYRYLLDHAWLNRSIPADIGALAKMLGKGVTKARLDKTLWPAIALCWVAMPGHPDRLVNRRMERERVKAEQHREERSRSGKEGAEKRWGKRSSANGSAINGENGTANSSAMGSEDGSAMILPLAKNSFAFASASASASKTNTQTEAEDRNPSAEPAKRTWLTPYADCWKSILGAEIPFGQAAKTLAPLEKQHGAAVVVKALTTYLRAHQGERASYVSLPKFSATFGQWRNPTPTARSTPQSRSLAAIDRALGDDDGQ